MNGYLRWTNLDLERHDGLPLRNSMDPRSFAAFTHRVGLRHGAGALGFRHESPTDDQRSHSHSHDGIEPGCTAEALGDIARERGTERGADAAEGSDNALPEVEPSGALRYVG